MAQDFRAAFGWARPNSAKPRWTPMVSPCRIPGLNAKLDSIRAAKDAEIATLRAELAELRAMRAELAVIRSVFASITDNRATKTAESAP